MRVSRMRAVLVLCQEDANMFVRERRVSDLPTFGSCIELRMPFFWRHGDFEQHLVRPGCTIPLGGRYCPQPLVKWRLA
jgi:hypothetical protein